NRSQFPRTPVSLPKDRDPPGLSAADRPPDARSRGRLARPALIRVRSARASGPSGAGSEAEPVSFQSSRLGAREVGRIRRDDVGQSVGRPPFSILSAPSAPLVNASRQGARSVPGRDAGRELAPAFAGSANRLLWRRRARPSATLDKMRAKL